MRRRSLIAYVDAAAALRQARRRRDPDPVAAATLAMLAGADGIGVELREDRRWVQDRDVRLLRHTVHHGFYLDIPPLPELLKVALEVRPDVVTLLPEQPDDPAPTAGLDVVTRLGPLTEMVRALEDGKTRSAFLVSPDIEQVKAAHRAGACGVQIWTGRFAEGGPDCNDELRRIFDSVRLAEKLGLEIALGGALDYRNVRALVELEAVAEFRVGHAIGARALLVGMERAVAEMKELVG